MASRATKLLVAVLAFAGAAFGQPTYANQVSRVFRAKCEICHRDGDIAPFALKDYDTAAAWSADIQTVLSNHTMPPWKPVAGFGDFKNSFALTGDERQTIFDWIAAGMPFGDPADLLDPLPDQGPWPLGAPDVVLQMPAPFTPARGVDVYRCFVLPSDLAAPTYLGAVDVQPGNRQIVHHVLLFVDTTGQAAQMDGQDGSPGYDCFGGPGITLNLNSTLGAWAPGQRGQFLPDGVGIPLPAHATVVMQVHYHPSAYTGPDQTSVGLYFARSDVEQQLYMIPVLNDSFTIPAGAPNFNVSTSFQVPPLFDAHLIWIFPHMHLLGRQIKVDVVNPDQTTTPLVYEDNWDFNWQGAYTYSSAVPIKAGSTVKLNCAFDNSADNPTNPNNPLVAVGWGERTTDEMCLAYLGVTLDNENLLPFAKRRRK
ncbi:MAG: ascorbate-dependent monooxygenase [Bryobacteraceae bacterium]